MADFMYQLLDLTFFLFDKTESVILIVPFVVLFFCLTLGFIKMIVRGRL